jgi:hypothetical protein
MTDTALEVIGRFHVTSREEYEEAARIAREVQTRIKDAEEQRQHITRPLIEARDRAIAAERAITGPLKEVLDYLKGEMGLFDRAERERVEQEQADAEARLSRAMEEGRLTDADEALTDLTLIPEPMRKPAGIGRSVSWSAEVEDIDQVLAAVLRGDLPKSIIQPSPSGLLAYARQQKVEGSSHGVRVIKTGGVSVGRK